MNREQIIQIAREAGLEEMWELTPRFTKRLERFAAAIRADTKEEDAKICESLSVDAASQKRQEFLTDAGKQLYEGMYGGCKQCESAIRASK